MPLTRPMFLAVAIAAFLTVSAIVPAAAIAQQPDPESPRYKGVVALAEFIGSSGDAAVEDFIEKRIAMPLRESMGDDSLFETLAAMRDELEGAEMRGGRPISELSAELVMDHADGRQLSVEFELDAADVDRFTMISTPVHTIGG